MLRTFFGKQPREREAPKLAKAQHGIPFDPGLITALTHQHRELAMLLVKASSTAEQCSFTETAETLARFEAGLGAHLRRESGLLIPYLAAHLGGEDARELVREMRTHSALIERTVKGFLDRYRDAPVDADSMHDFVIEIERVCEEFCQEAEREEASCYTLYMAPEAY